MLLINHSHGEKMVRYLLPIFLIPILLTGQYERPGSAAAQFLKIDVSPRGSSMAGAYIAVVEGAEAAWYNPARIARIMGTGISLNHTAWFTGINVDFISWAQSFGRKGAFAFSVTTLYTPEMKVRTPMQPDGTGETFYAGSLRAGLSFARQLTYNVCFGVTTNYIYLALYSDFTQNAVSIDFSVDYQSDYHGLRFAMKIANFGSNIKFVNEVYPMPTNFNFGLSFNALDAVSYKLVATGAIIKPNDGAPLGQIGTELQYNNLLFLRGGYHIGHSSATIALGGGYRQTLGSKSLEVNYSWEDYSTLGGTHRFGFQFDL